MEYLELTVTRCKKQRINFIWSGFTVNVIFDFFNLKIYYIHTNFRGM